MDRYTLLGRHHSSGHDCAGHSLSVQGKWLMLTDDQMKAQYPFQVTMASRATRAVVFLSLVWLSWLLMMLVHEFGHVVAAVATGGTVQRVVWHPLAISRTDVAPNPSPLLVAWAGPVVGSLLPLLATLILWRTRFRPLAAFFAGFCLIANGAYIGVGWLDRVGDAGEIVRLGSPRWLLVLFGMIASTAGLWLWHRASPRPKPVA